MPELLESITTASVTYNSPASIGISVVALVCYLHLFVTLVQGINQGYHGLDEKKEIHYLETKKILQ